MTEAGILKDIIDIIEKYGILGVGIVLGFAIISGIVKGYFSGNLLSKFGNFLLSFQNNSNQVNITKSNIENHDILYYLDFWINSKIPTLEFSTEYRTEVFRLYLTIYLISFRNNIKDIINKESYQHMDRFELTTYFIKEMQKIVFEYEQNAKLKGIPPIIIQKMKVKNNNFIQLNMNLIENITSSNYYHSENNLLKVYSILNITCSMLDNTLVNSEKVCNNINGELKGKKFNGKIEP